ncbi:sialomucin core protein 24 [Callorhinchus milii]|uniref:Sialomucin core protein 24 n=1 Tax=Callorhinchus milii TaxID=7868 RepID=A0A4W3JUM9_CALMI|nr:sialomucin core protein 24 [Callorhinchus milii]|eukprot:gi/632951035/ref/XP_007891073.1/ PREDICTED: sialomucin core protein 24 [Callorhinchus milii]
MASPLVMHWPLVCGALAALLLCAGLSLGAGICEDRKNCTTCLSTADQNVSCFWQECKGNSSCVNASLHVLVNCSALNESCQAPTTPSTTTIPTPTSTNSSSNSSTTVPPTVNTTTIITSTPTTAHSTGTTNGTTAVPPYKKTSTFDAASFIGGIVLVLGLQAVVFFAVKFCKTKDRNYHTL